MARSTRQSSGQRVEIPSCAAAHSVGDIVLENGFLGEIQATVAAGQPATLIIDGRFKMRVPAGAVQGQYLQMGNTLPAAPANGSLIANLQVTNAVVVAAGATNTGTLVGQVMEAPVNNLAGVLLTPQLAGKR